MPLMNCKIHLELNWNNSCVMHGADTYAGGDNANDRETLFKITSAKLYVKMVTLSTKDNVNLTKQLNEGFKKADANNLKRFPLDASFQGANRLFVLAFDHTNNGANRVERDSQRK